MTIAKSPVDATPSAKTAPAVLQDSRPFDERLLYDLLDVGVVVLDDARRCRDASRAACELLGVDDPSALRARWEAIGSDLGIGELACLQEDTALWQRRADVRTPAGSRGLRIEAHALREGGVAQYILLLRDRSQKSASDGALGLVAEAQANRHLLHGYLHQAKGPLNNFRLTLALLSSRLVKLESSSAVEAEGARWRRHLELLQAETSRLSDCLHQIDALTWKNDGASEAVDLCEMIREVEWVLRHEAAVLDVTLVPELATTPAWVVANARALRYALLGFAETLLHATRPSGTIALSVQVAAPDVLLHLGAQPATLPDQFGHELFRVTGTPESSQAAAIAGRVVIEALGGEVILEQASGSAGFAIRMHAPAQPPQQSPLGGPG
jgi:signal transduction histidine kinase